MPFLTRLGAAASRVLGLFSRTGPTVSPTITSTSSSGQSVITIIWTNTSIVFPINVYLNGFYWTQVSAGTTSASFGGFTCGTTNTFRLAYTSGGSIGPLSNQVSQYVTPISAGTYAGQFCNGCTLNHNYHNGNCGFYSQQIQFNSPSCGCTPPLESFAQAVGYDFNCGCSSNVLVSGSHSWCGGWFQAAGQMCCQGYATTQSCSQPGSWTVYGGICAYGDLELQIWRSPSQNVGSWYIGTVASCGYFSYGGYSVYVS